MIECNVLDGEYPKKSHGEILMLHVYTINDLIIIIMIIIISVFILEDGPNLSSFLNY